MKELLENYGGIVLFYLVIIIGGTLLCSRADEIAKQEESSFYTAQVETR